MKLLLLLLLAGRAGATSKKSGSSSSSKTGSQASQAGNKLVEEKEVEYASTPEGKTFRRWRLEDVPSLTTGPTFRLNLSSSPVYQELSGERGSLVSWQSHLDGSGATLILEHLGPVDGQPWTETTWASGPRSIAPLGLRITAENSSGGQLALHEREREAQSEGGIHFILPRWSAMGKCLSLEEDEKGFFFSDLGVYTRGVEFEGLWCQSRSFGVFVSAVVDERVIEAAEVEDRHFHQLWRFNLPDVVLLGEKSVQLQASGEQRILGEGGAEVDWGANLMGSGVTLRLQRLSPASELPWTDLSWRFGSGPGFVWPVALRITGRDDRNEMMILSELERTGWRRRVPLESTGFYFRLPEVVGERLECLGLQGDDKSFFFHNSRVRRADPEEIAVLVGWERKHEFWCWTPSFGTFVAAERSLPGEGCKSMGLSLSALSERQGWITDETTMELWWLLASLLVAGGIGFIWEWRSLRFGRTRQEDMCSCCSYAAEESMAQAENTVDEEMQDAFGEGFWAFWQHVVRSKIRLTCRSGAKHLLMLYWLAARTGINVDCVEGECWEAGEPWVQESLSLPRTVLAWKMGLYDGALDSAVEELCAIGPLRSLWRLLVIFVALHPVVDSVRVGAGSMTVAKRCVMEINRFLGIQSVGALVWALTGQAQSFDSDPACPFKETTRLATAFTTLFAWLVTIVPRALLRGLADWGLHRPVIGDIYFWVAALGYLQISFLIVMLRSANINESDAEDASDLLRQMLVLDLFLNTAMTLRLWLPHEVQLLRLGGKQLRWRLRSALRLQHCKDQELPPEEEAAAQSWAGRGVTATELLRITSLLGEQLMPGFNESSSSEDVLQQALLPLAEDGPAVAEAVVEVEVLGVKGLECEEPLLCRVRQLPPQGSCLSEAASGTLQGAQWSFSARVPRLEPRQSLEIELTWLGGQSVGTARLPASELFGAEKGCWSGELPLEEASCENNGGNERPRLVVEVRVPRGYLSALASFTPDWLQQAEPVQQEDEAPPDVMVLHSRQGSFQTLVAAVLAHLVGESPEAAEARLAARDFPGALAALREAGAEQSRCWLELFAVEPSALKGEREALRRSMPAVFRGARRLQHARAVQDLKAKRSMRAGPLVQLVAVTTGPAFLQDAACVSELLLARAMALEQRVMVHPAHEGVSEDLEALELEEAPSPLNGVEKAMQSVDWTRIFAGLAAATLVQGGMQAATDVSPEQAEEHVQGRLEDGTSLVQEVLQVDPEAAKPPEDARAPEAAQAAAVEI